VNVAFFDIGGTLGSPRFSPPPHQRLQRLDVYTGVPEALAILREHKVRLGLISNIGSESPAQVRSVLEECGLYRFFEPSLLVYGVKESPAIFRHAAALASRSHEPSLCIFVGENGAERELAMAAGLLVASHPALAWDVLRQVSPL
jgi:bacterial leucyl aminopeptidase